MIGSGMLDDLNASEIGCSCCKATIRGNQGHYRICYVVQRYGGKTRDSVDATINAILCAKCSLNFDLTQLLVPTHAWEYYRDPVESSGLDLAACRDCRRRYAEGELFHTAAIVPVNLLSESDGTTVEISYCRQCAAEYQLRGAEPPTTKIGSPYCYQCGKVEELKYMMVQDPKQYEKRHDLPIEVHLDGRVNVCKECFWAEIVLTEEEMGQLPDEDQIL